MGLSLGGYIIPYFFIYQPAILMQSESILMILRVLITVLIAMFFIEAGVFGYFLKPTSLLERTLFVVGGLLLLSSTWQTDVIGFGLVALAIIGHLFFPNIPVIGKRSPEPQKVDFSKLSWKDSENTFDLTSG